MKTILEHAEDLIAAGWHFDRAMQYLSGFYGEPEWSIRECWRVWCLGEDGLECA